MTSLPLREAAERLMNQWDSVGLGKGDEHLIEALRSALSAPSGEPDDHDELTGLLSSTDPRIKGWCERTADMLLANGWRRTPAQASGEPLSDERERLAELIDHWNRAKLGSVASSFPYPERYELAEYLLAQGVRAAALGPQAGT